MATALATIESVHDQAAIRLEHWLGEEALQDTDWPATNRQTANQQDHITYHLDLVEDVWD